MPHSALQMLSATPARASKCDGKTQTAQAVAAKAKAMYERFEKADTWYHTQVVRLDSDEFRPPHTANAELKNLARVYAHLRGLDETVAMASIMLLLPFALALLTEFGSIVFLKHGFGRRKPPAVAKVGEPESGPRTDADQPSVHEPTPTNGSREPMNRPALRPGSSRGPLTKAQAERDLITYITLNGRVPSQDLLRARWGLRSKGTVSGWLADWERQGLIHRRLQGKCKVTTAANR